jgi:hypothetical protein
MNTGNNQSALREALKKEDASLSTRIPDAATPATAEPAAVAAEPKREEAGTAAVKAAKSPTASAAKMKKGASTAPSQSAANKSAAPPASPSNPAPKTKTKATTKAEKKAAAATANKVAKDGKRAKAAKPVEKSKPEKRVRRAVSLAASEHKQLKVLRADLKDAGHPTKRAHLLRAALSTLVGRTEAEVVALVKALPALVKGKSAKKKR